MNPIWIGVISSLLTTSLVSVVIFIFKNIFLEGLKHAMKIDQEKFLDELRWSRKVQEQAARVSEYLALARSLEEDSPKDEYERANQLSWELAMWLPSDIYKKMTFAIAGPTQENNELTVVIEVRKILLGKKSGDLSADDIAHHAPGIGTK